MNSALAGGVLKKTAQQIASGAAADMQAPIDRKLDELRRSRGWIVAEKVMLGSDVAVLWLMIAKPALAESIAIFVAATVIVGSTALLGRKESNENAPAAARS